MPGQIRPKGRKLRAKTLPLSSFWVSKSLEQLASEQAVYPIDDVSQLTGDWPEGEDFEDFLKAVMSSHLDIDGGEPFHA